jgi:hypothetical protein
LWPAAALLALFLVAPGRIAAQDSPHGDLSLECSECHSTSGWTPLAEPLEFDHSEVGRPLELGHEGLECVTCHTSLVFAFVGSSCADCHEDPHRGELGFDCEACHQPASWDNRRSMFDLHSGTLFPLTGVHATVDCAGCHRREPPFEYALTPTDCFSCHFDDYQSTRDPNHVSAGFPTDCQVCHNTVEWEGVDFIGGFGFDHSAQFQLTGEHARLDCTDCHSDGFSGTPSACVACHRTEYDGTSDPNHRSAGFGTSCENCHGTSTWEGAVTDHNAFFALTGQHRALDCSDCHTSGFQGTPTDCVACHRSEYNATTDPNHQAAGFGTDCEACHNTSGWAGASVNHNQFWPLTGSHGGLDCEVCHANGFAGTPTDCNACHSADYDATTNPNHQASGFPRDCESCHNTTTWEGATFNHSFPIFSGNHSQGAVWDDCSECHTNASNFSIFTCVTCHERNEMDDEHDDVGGYVYESTECLACHPDGREDD